MLEHFYWIPLTHELTDFCFSYYKFSYFEWKTYILERQIAHSPRFYFLVFYEICNLKEVKFLVCQLGKFLETL
jgi:hypothetical protein